MQILRIPPYPLSVTYTVPESNENYILVIEDIAEQLEVATILTSNSNSTITHVLDEDFIKYDKSYALTIYEDIEEERGDIVVEDNLEIMRPYVDPSTLATSGTATDISLYTEYEGLARAIIDSIVGGFYYERTYLEVVGQGNDYLPLWKKSHKILKVYENAELVYDINDLSISNEIGYTFLITKDKTAIIKDPVENVSAINRAERRYARIPFASSDSMNMFDTEDNRNTQTVVPGVFFTEGTDYIVLLETGYKVVPYDIQDATKMLIEDIKCGKLDHYKRYVSKYSTDQFKIEYDKTFVQGTGNIIVDKILEKYKENIIRPGVL